jgi:hypothetical protein
MTVPSIPTLLDRAQEHARDIRAHATLFMEGTATDGDMVTVVMETAEALDNVVEALRAVARRAHPDYDPFFDLYLYATPGFD